MLRLVPTRLNFFLFVSLIAIFSSCRENNNETPTLIFSQPKNEAILWGITTIDLTPDSEINQSRIDLFLNDSLIASLNKTPYSFELDTKLIKDGEHLLKAVLLNDLTTVQLKISIRNKLLKMTVENDHLTPDTRGFIFLSDAEGRTFASQEFKNGDQVIINHDNYPSGNFMLSEAYVVGTEAINLYSFQEVPRGEWTLLRENEDPAIINSLGLDFIGISSDYYYVSSSGDAEFLYGKNSLDLNINKTPSRLFVREYKQPINRFKIINDLNPTDRQIISLSDITTPLSIEKIKLSGGMNKRGAVTLYGYPLENSFQEYYNLGSFFSKNAEVTIEYPGNGFPVYASTSFFADNDISINSFQRGKKSDLLPLTVETSFKSSEGQSATVATYGEIDIFAATWIYFNQKLGTSAYWAMIGPPGRSQVIKLPELPAEIKAAAYDVNISDIVFSNTLGVTDFEIAIDYPTYIKYISKNSLTSPYAFGKSWKEQIFSKSGSTSGKIDTHGYVSLSNKFFRK